MKVTLIYNRGAGADNQPSSAEVLELVRAAGHDVVELSPPAGDRSGGLHQPVDLIAVAGGDGTVGRIVKRLLPSGTPIGILPVGTANNIAKSLGILAQPLPEWIAGWKSARRVKFDIGTASGPWGAKLFIEAVGIGLFTGTMSRLDSTGNFEIVRRDRSRERIASAMEILCDRLQNYPAHELHCSIDGKPLSGAYILLEVMNTPFVGPNLFLAPKADPTDGLLDVVVLPKDERHKFADYLLGCMKGKFRAPRLPVRQVRRLTMEWSGFAVHLDDEVWPDKDGTLSRSSMTIDVAVNRHAVEFLAPK